MPTPSADPRKTVARASDYDQAAALAVPPVGPYGDGPVDCELYDIRVAMVARSLTARIRLRLAGAVVEHVGSTAVRGTAGTGIVDVLVVLGGDALARAAEGLAAIGFTRLRTRDEPWPFQPAWVGSVPYGGRVFRIHVHVHEAQAPEVAAMREFRDRLLGNHRLLAAYVVKKREVIAAGATSMPAYAAGKATFFTP